MADVKLATHVAQRQIGVLPVVDGIDGMHTPNVEGVESAARGPYGTLPRPPSHLDLLLTWIGYPLAAF